MSINKYGLKRMVIPHVGIQFAFCVIWNLEPLDYSPLFLHYKIKKVLEHAESKYGILESELIMIDEL